MLRNIQFVPISSFSRICFRLSRKGKLRIIYSTEMTFFSEPHFTDLTDCFLLQTPSSTFPHRLLCTYATGLAAPGPVGIISPLSSNTLRKYSIVFVNPT